MQEINSAKEVKDVKEEKLDPKREVFQWMQSLIFSVIVVALIFTFVGRIMNVRGSSMEPTFSNNDKIITTNIHGDYKYGDIVVIKRKDSSPLFKRIIAVEGDVIDIDFSLGEVRVNNVLLDEPYINEPTYDNHGMKFPLTVSEDHVFVMGDNRNHSDDSRNPDIGLIDERNIFGKVVFRLYPFNKMGVVSFDADLNKQGEQ